MWSQHSAPQIAQNPTSTRLARRAAHEKRSWARYFPKPKSVCGSNVFESEAH